MIIAAEGQSRTIPGKMAEEMEQNEATIWLNLSGDSDEYKKHIVICEFGHVLGLGYEHQHSNFFNHIKPFITVERKNQDLNNGWKNDEKVTAETITAYDPHSVMHCR